MMACFRITHPVLWICLLVLASGPVLSQPRPGTAGAGAGQSAADRQVQARAERQAERALERAAEQAQRAQGRASERAQSSAESRAQSRALERMSPVAAERIESAAGRRPAVNIPARVPVADSAGATAFVDIQVTPGIRAIEHEWVMLLDAGQRQQLEDQAPDLMRLLVQTRPFEAVDAYLLKFLVPPDLDANDAIVDLVPEPLRHLIDRNHVYTQQGGPFDGSGKLPLPMRSVCTDNLGIGVIDSAVNVAHPAFAAEDLAQRLVVRDFVEDGIARPDGHGTAVVSVLVGEGPDLFPLLPGATVFTASVAYARDDVGGAVTLMQLLEALGWLATEPLSVINMSLTGPDNRLLAQGINIVNERGKVVVAAAGNEGPHAPTAYPAGYDGVVAATAVAQDTSVYRWANQGEYVDFAAFGVSVPVALADGGFGEKSGTSLAAPVISAFVACALAANGNSRERALLQLQREAVDLGEPGHDPVFGHGLLHPVGNLSGLERVSYSD